MGLEALSRGAKQCVFVDAGRPAIELITKNISLCGLADRCIVVRRDLARGLFFLKELRPAVGFHLIFIDPPYRLGLAGRILTELAAGDLIHPLGRIIVEHSARQELPELVGDLMLIDRRRYGEAGFWFYQKMRSPEQ
jgi:16S rRNA (guanine(966)-N(2))-methyltransferase RsmD